MSQMLIFLPVIIMGLTALTLFILRLSRPNFRFPWLLASIGAILALGGVFAWQIHFPQTFSLRPWQLGTAFFRPASWLADGVSWPYALSLAALAVAVIGSSVVRNEHSPMAWAGTLALTGLGILAVAAENPLALLLAWSGIDLVELVTMLRSTEGEGPTSGVIIAFAVRLAGTGMVLWAGLVSAAARTEMDFRSVPAQAGLYLLIAAGLRLGVLPLHLPYQQDNVLRRGMGTVLRLVSASASLALLARIPASSLNSPLIPFLIILAAITALYSSWMWFRASDEIIGRPYWILGMASLAVSEVLRGNPVGTIGWGVCLVLCGGVLFLFSARQRRILWLPAIGLFVISTFPYSLTAAAWNAGNSISWVTIIPFLPAEGLLLAGFFRRILLPGETSLESQERWVKVIYPASLLLLMAVAVLLGFWGWEGAKQVGQWWLAVIGLVLSAGLVIIALRFSIPMQAGSVSDRWVHIFRLDRFYPIIKDFFNTLRKVIEVLTGSFEGDAGLLWSLLLLVLILSILSTASH